jgi:dipeptidyl aminopeptidase/acylaminoacyl peptidase
MKRALLFCSILFLAASTAAALPQAATEKAADVSLREKTWQPEDLIQIESAGQFRISPDAKWVVWVKSTPDKEKDGHVSNLLLSSLIEKKEIQLTRGTETHSQPRWSPDGEIISFMSTRPRPGQKPEQARNQLWLMHPYGGEPWHLTEFERGIRAYEWVDSNTILFSAEEDPTLYERELQRKKDATRVVEDHEKTPPVRLFRLSVKDKKVTRLTENDDWIQTWAVSPDGRRAVTVHQRSLAYQWDQKIPPVTFLYDLTTGQRTELYDGKKIRPFQVRWALDGSGVYVIAPYSTDPVFVTASITLLYFYDLASGQTTQVDLGWENGLAPGFEVMDDGFLALLAAGHRYEFARYTRAGTTWRRARITGEHAERVFGFAAHKNGRALVYDHSTGSKPTQWYRARLDTTEISTPVQLTSLNAHFDKKPKTRTEVVRWKGALDEEVEGILYYPHNYEAGKRHPLVLIIHGGPTGYDMDSWDDNWASPQQLLAQRGAFVLKPNYHGSGNYGLKWVESICCGKYYDLEVPDIEKGVDALIERGLVDAHQVATMGWSNGSILSIAVTIANPGRYKALSAGAGDVEWISDWANVDFGHAFDKYYFGKSPLEDPQLYLQKSPLFKMDRVKAPTIIFFGTEDRAVPTSQGWTHYRALYHLDQVPVRFLLFPGEPHSPQKLTHQLRKVEEEIRWFDRYLFKTEAAANDAFKEDSPLGLAFRRKSIQKVGPHFGVAHRATARGRAGETVIPEVVRRGELEVGRFEVTRAQYAAFDRSYRVEPGTENFPANGITLENAKAYAEWLSKLTGEKYRLGYEEEIGKLYGSREGENTLDYWAGYAVNPDDAARLAEKVKELPGAAPLLTEVGRFKGAGREEEELLYDLGGNVAEWVLLKDGSGKIIGGSADRPADAKAQERPAAPAYTGFRIVREPRPK